MVVLRARSLIRRSAASMRESLRLGMESGSRDVISTCPYEASFQPSQHFQIALHCKGYGNGIPEEAGEGRIADESKLSPSVLPAIETLELKL